MRNEDLFALAVQKNVTCLEVGGTKASVISGPLRLTSADPRAAKALAVTALAGSARKEVAVEQLQVVSGTVAASTAYSDLRVGLADLVITHTAAIRACALRITLGYPLTGNFNRNTAILDIAGTGMSPMTIAMQPTGTDVAQVFVLLVTDNGGPGQISAPSGITVTYAVAKNCPGIAGTSAPASGSFGVPKYSGFTFSLSSEVMTLRDFEGGRTGS